MVTTIAPLDLTPRLYYFPNLLCTDSANPVVLGRNIVIRSILGASQEVGEQFRTHYATLLAVLVWGLANEGRIIDDSIKARQRSVVRLFRGAAGL